LGGRNGPGSKGGRKEKKRIRTRKTAKELGEAKVQKESGSLQNVMGGGAENSPGPKTGFWPQERGGDSPGPERGKGSEKREEKRKNTGNEASFHVRRFLEKKLN